ncbi:hypothetical protein MTR67_027840 [Solanum verrucosum]|uniref:Uncharacterized protein n=1 Tax=Solanum verrucosum TaxID=315347 RepID=A0AAF0R857_SOLVR|nr:hypothetical protein MTR67_027840 [Solanum verrucosum]
MFAPLVVPVGAVYFGYRYVVDKYNFLFVYRMRGLPAGNDGRLMDIVLSIMRFCILITLEIMYLLIVFEPVAQGGLLPSLMANKADEVYGLSSTNSNLVLLQKTPTPPTTSARDGRIVTTLSFQESSETIANRMQLFHCMYTDTRPPTTKSIIYRRIQGRTT